MTEGDKDKMSNILLFKPKPRHKLEPNWTGTYILDEDKNPVPVDFIQWGMWFEDTDKRRFTYTVIGNIHISTVFLGLDHKFSFQGPPILFETMVFHNGESGEMERYATWEEAEKGHRRIASKWAFREVRRCRGQGRKYGR